MKRESEISKWKRRGNLEKSKETKLRGRTEPYLPETAVSSRQKSSPPLRDSPESPSGSPEMKNREGVSGENDCEAEREKTNLLKMSERDALWCHEFWEAKVLLGGECATAKH